MFEGKEIDFITPLGEHLKAIVVACTKDIGISIIEKDTKEHIFCLCMKNAPNFNSSPGEITATRKSFTAIRKQIIA